MECGIDEWRDKPLRLHVDHVNGTANDNRFENLRLLCPNCHSQTETYAARNRKKKNHERCERRDSNPHGLSATRS